MQTEIGTDADKAKGFVEELLGGYGYEKVSKTDDLKEKKYLTGASGVKSKVITFAFNSEAEANDLIVYLESFSIDAIPQKNFPNEFKVYVQAVCTACDITHPLGFENREDLPGTLEQPSAKVVLDKNSEIEIIKKLLSIKDIKHSIPKHDNKDSTLYVIFRTSRDLDIAKKILDVNRVDFFLGDEKDVLISLALPDALLNGAIAGETIDQKYSRRLTEFSQRLRLLLKFTLGLTIKTVAGKGLLKVGQVVLSGQDAMQRINFTDVALRNIAEKALAKAGFYCEMPINGEELTVIVDLSRSTQETLLQSVEPELLTRSQIKEKIASDPLLVLTSSSTADNFLALFFENPEQVQLALAMFQDIIPGITVKARGLLIPFTSYKRNAGRGGSRVSTKKGSPEPVFPVSDISPKKEGKKEKLVEEPVITGSDELFALFKNKLSEEISARLTSEQADTVSLLKKEIADLKSQHYLIPKTGGDSITIPADELGAGVVIDGKNGLIIISKTMFEDF